MARIGAVLLAAGASRRFGPESKLLADVGGQPLITRVFREVVKGGVEQIVVVTGFEAERIQAALKGLRARFVHNADWAGGMGCSIATGITALTRDLDGAFIVPSDMPFIATRVLRALIDEFKRAGSQSIVFPATPSGEQRNPVLWPRRMFVPLTMLCGPEGAKRLLAAQADQCRKVVVDDVSVFADIDTMADLLEARGCLDDKAASKQRVF